jgi:hypothetical protein
MMGPSTNSIASAPASGLSIPASRAAARSI